MANLERLKPATWKFEGLMPRIEPIQNLRALSLTSSPLTFAHSWFARNHLTSADSISRYLTIRWRLALRLVSLLGLVRISADHFNVVKMAAWLTLILWLSLNHLIRSFYES
jgi:hypothetical protein